MLDRSHHVFLIAAVIAKAWILLVAAEPKISPPTLGHVPSWPPCQPTPTRWPCRHSATPVPSCIHDAGDFVPGNTRIEDPRRAALDNDRIAVAHAACLDFDTHLSRAWIGNLPGQRF